jgi:alpha-ketoglutarate-dependent taurine dioxygenase
MAIEAKSRLTVTTLKPRIGSRVIATIEDLLSGEHAAEILRLLDKRIVLCFPGTYLSAEQQIAFTRTLGTRNEDLSRDIWKVSADAAVNPDPKIAEYQRSSFKWHMDGIYTPVPDLATTLSAQVLSETIGGQTEVANMYAAFEDLPEEDKSYFETLRVVHSFEAQMRSVTPSPSDAQLQEWRSRDEKTRPLVWRHKSGRKSLVIGAHASHIEGMALEQGRAILRRLEDWATQPQYVYSHEWVLGDLVMFNNSGSLHRAVEYPLDSGRLMNRTSLRGVEAIE